MLVTRRNPLLGWFLTIASLLLVYCNGTSATPREEIYSQTITTQNLRASRNLKENQAVLAASDENIGGPSLPALSFSYGIMPPKDAFPLQRCEGHCKNDGQCAGDLVCQDREEAGTVVPGCFNYDDGINYCVSVGGGDDVDLGETSGLDVSQALANNQFVAQEKDTKPRSNVTSTQDFLDTPIATAREEFNASEMAPMDFPVIIATEMAHSSNDTHAPTSNTTSSPTNTTTSAPTNVSFPTLMPSVISVSTDAPTDSPVDALTLSPTEAQTTSSTTGTSMPTSALTIATTNVTVRSDPPTTGAPSEASTGLPTVVPTSIPTSMPTTSPTGTPTAMPTSSPTGLPTVLPTGHPSGSPSTKTPTTEAPTVASGQPSVSPTTVSPTGAPTETPTQQPITSLPSLSPSIKPSTLLSPAPTHDISTSVPTVLPKRIVSYGGTPPSRFFPLQRCEGDCDVDSDCAPGLVCFQKDTRTAVPGCLGGIQDESLTDYCVLASVDTPAPAPVLTSTPTEATPTLPPSSNPTIATSFMPTRSPSAPPKKRVSYGGTPPGSVFPLKLCEGDCDDDSDCAPGLVCFQRDPGMAVPGCLNGERDTSFTDYCVTDTGSPTKAPTGGSSKLVGYGGTPPASVFPLQLCEGDCDLDTDCDDGLVCFQRGPGIPVPGCLGGDKEMSRTDFCIADPSSRQMPTILNTSPTGPPSLIWNTAAPATLTTVVAPKVLQSKQIRLYWEPTYFWQEEEEERKWCMMYDYDGLPGTGKCWYEQETRPCNSEELYMAKCNNDRRQKLDLAMLSSPGDNRDLFMIKAPGKAQCLELQDDRSIVFRECDAQSELQHWKTTNGSLDDIRFEIVPVSLPNHCVTQDHHPKAGEVIRIYRCELPRASDSLTSFWEFY